MSISIDVTVTVDVSYTLPPWSCNTPGCDDVIIHDCVHCDIGTGGVIVVVNNEINIHIDSCVDICGDGPDGNTVVIVVSGCIGTVCADIDVDVIVYNPCFDPNYYSIMPVPEPDHECTINMSCTWTHV